MRRRPDFNWKWGLIELAQIPRMRPLEDLIADFTRLVEGGSPQGAATARPAMPAPPGNRPAGPKSEAPPAGPGYRTGPQLLPSRMPPAHMPRLPRRRPPLPIPARIRSGGNRLAAGADCGRCSQGIAGTAPAFAGRRQPAGEPRHSGPGASLNEFLRRQLSDNLAMISEAASSVVGRTVQVQFEDLVPDAAQASTCRGCGQAACRKKTCWRRPGENRSSNPSSTPFPAR